MQIRNMKCNQIRNPLGFHLGQPVLSWVTEAPQAHVQLAAQVVVATDESFTAIVLDSGKSAAIDSLGFELEIPLLASTRYFWRVTVWTDAGEVKSSPAWFETAKQDLPWQAEWITPDWEDNNIHPLLRRDFAISGEIIKARLSICGVGLYEAEINGQRVGEDYLAPFCNAYDHWLQYQTYDVTSLLIKGANALGVRLGNGWYKGRFGFDNYGQELYGDRFALISELVVTLADGQQIVVGSDASWKAAAGPVVDSNIYDGEIRDARLNPTGWSLPGFADSTWQGVRPIAIGLDRLQARQSLPVKIMETVQPQRMIHTPKAEWVLDIGQNMVGWLRFTTSAPAGTEIVLTYSEELQDGCFYRENLRTAKAEFRYTADGQTREVEPHFTFYGFRYVKIEGWPGQPDPADFTGCVVYSELEQIGQVETSDPQVNRLFLNALWGQKGNFLDVPTDCPQRDERMGWTGDATVFSGTACFNMDSTAFYHKFLYDLAYEQRDQQGSVPNFVPTFGIGKDDLNGFMSGGAAVWGDAATIIPWNVYLHSGDKSILRKQFSSMKSWVDFITSRADESGLWSKGFQFGDWLALDGADPFSPMGGTDPHLIATAFYRHSAQIIAKAATVLGDPQTAQHYEQLADKIKQAFQAEYLTATGRLAVETQTAHIVALQFDLVPDTFKARVADSLRKKLNENNLYLKTGFVGSPYLCRVLSDHGMNDLAYQLLLNEDFPSWLYEVKMGATTIWERWNSILPDGHFGELGMNSLNHYAYGSIAEWMYRNLTGLQPSEDAPGFRKVRLAPQPHGRLRWAKSAVDSASGRYESSWQIQDDGQLAFDFLIPFNAQATVQLPDAELASITLNGQPLSVLTPDARQAGTDVTLTLASGQYKISYLPTTPYLIRYSTALPYVQLLSDPHSKKVLQQYVPELVARGNNGMIRMMGQGPMREMAKHPIIAIADSVIAQIDLELAKL